MHFSNLLYPRSNLLRIHTDFSKNTCYQRIIFVRPVNNLSEILNYIEEKAHQTIGLCINEGEKKDFAKSCDVMSTE